MGKVEGDYSWFPTTKALVASCRVGAVLSGCCHIVICPHQHNAAILSANLLKVIRAIDYQNFRPDFTSIVCAVHTCILNSFLFILVIRDQRPVLSVSEVYFLKTSLFYSGID